MQQGVIKFNYREFAEKNLIITENSTKKFSCFYVESSFYLRDFEVKGKFWLLIIGLFFVCLPFCKSYESKEIYFFNQQVLLSQGLEEETNEKLEEIDFGSLDEILNDNDGFVKNKTFIEIVKNFLNSENSELFNDFLPYLISTIFENFTSIVPFFVIIISICLLSSLMGNINSKSNSSLSVVNLISFSLIAVIVLKLIFDLLSSSFNVLNLIDSQMEVLFPILLTLITALGGSATVVTFQPLLAVMSSLISKFFTSFLVPIFIFSVVFGVVGNLSNNVRLEKFSKFFTSLFNYSVGVCFTIFIAYITINGISVSTIDSISLKTAKFAIKSYVPILGSYLSDGVGLILFSTALIKNSIGVSGILVLFSVILSPIIKILLVILLLKLVSSLLEPVSDAKYSNFLFAVSKSLNMLLVSLIAVSFMYVLSLSLIMSCSNIL